MPDWVRGGCGGVGGRVRDPLQCFQHPFKTESELIIAVAIDAVPPPALSVRPGPSFTPILPVQRRVAFSCLSSFFSSRLMNLAQRTFAYANEPLTAPPPHVLKPRARFRRDWQRDLKPLVRSEQS